MDHTGEDLGVASLEHQSVGGLQVFILCSGSQLFDQVIDLPYQSVPAKLLDLSFFLGLAFLFKLAKHPEFVSSSGLKELVSLTCCDFVWLQALF